MGIHILKTNFYFSDHYDNLHCSEEIAECTSEEQTVWVEKKVGLDEEITKVR